MKKNTPQLKEKKELYKKMDILLDKVGNTVTNINNTQNIQLNDLIGQTLSIGEIKIKAHDLCRPCKSLQKKLGKDNIIKEFLRRGGLRCEILNSGNIKIGDNIKTI